MGTLLRIVAAVIIVNSVEMMATMLARDGGCNDDGNHGGCDCGNSDGGAGEADDWTKPGRRCKSSKICYYGNGTVMT